MNVKSYLLVAALPVTAGLAVTLAMGQPRVHENSRRINTDPIYVKNQENSLKLASLGHTAIFHGNYVLAERELRQSIALDASGGEVGAWSDLGRTLEEQGRTEEAYAAYKEAFDSPKRGGYSSFPHDVGTLTHYGIMCENNGQHEAAVRAYNKAVDELNPSPTKVALDIPADPKGTPIPRLRALLDVMRGLTAGEEKNLPGGQNRSGEALEAFQEAAQQEPNDARVQYYLGYGSQKAGQFAAAQAAYGRASRLDTAGAVKAAAVEGARAAQVRRR